MLLEPRVHSSPERRTIPLTEYVLFLIFYENKKTNTRSD